MADTQALLERQNTEDSPEALESIPKLSLDEINKKAREVVLYEEEFKGHKLLYHPGYTGGIAYVKFYFDTHTVPQEDLKYLSLVNKIIGRVSTEDYDYERLNQEIEISTGGISSSVETYDNIKESGRYESKFAIKGKAVGANVKRLLELIESTILRSRFDERHLIEDIVGEIRMNKENQFLMGGHTVSVQRLQSYYSQSARMFEELGGIEFTSSFQISTIILTSAGKSCPLSLRKLQIGSLIKRSDHQRHWRQGFEGASARSCGRIFRKPARQRYGNLSLSF